MAAAASRTWMYGRQNCSPKTTSDRARHTSRVNSFTVRSKRMRADVPYTVANRRHELDSPFELARSTCSSAATFVSAYTDTGRNAASSVTCTSSGTLP